MNHADVMRFYALAENFVCKLEMFMCYVHVSKKSHISNRRRLTITRCLDKLLLVNDIFGHIYVELKSIHSIMLWFEIVSFRFLHHRLANVFPW